MTKRIIAAFLAVLTIFSMLAVPASAASSLEEAMAEVDIYAKHDSLNWLTMNGSIKEQHYTYYLYTSERTGQTKEIPAYCVDPFLYGVPQKAPEGTAVKYSVESAVSDPKVCGIISNGYPHMQLSDLGLQSVSEAYYATKTALWIYLIGDWTISGLGINPNLGGADRAAAQRVLDATKAIYERGMYWTELYTPKLTATADQPTATKATINGVECYQQTFLIDSDTWALTPVHVSLDESAPAGTKIMDMDNHEISEVLLDTTRTQGAGYQARVKVVYPASVADGESGTCKLILSGSVVEYKIFAAKTLEADRYGNLQEYMLDTDPDVPLTANAISSFSGNPPPPDDSTLTIYKREVGTNTLLDGAVFEILYPDGSSYGSFSTQNGVISVPIHIYGNYTVTELTPPAYHLLPEERTQHVTVTALNPGVLTFWDEPYGNLRVHKTSNTGENLVGVTIQIKNLETGATQTAKTGPGGVCSFTQLKPGGYEVRETAGIEGWILDDEAVKTATVVAGETSEVRFVNKELPGLRIRKYDRSAEKLALMPDVTFDIWRDGTSLGRFTTDLQGEIRLLNAQPGTYLVQEVDTGDPGFVLDRTPQQIELRAGDGIRDLVFFNDRKPSINRLIKVDSSDLAKPIANAVFEVKSVDGSYGPVELRTQDDGTISLENLPCAPEGTAYVVTEKSCAGYVIDDAQRIIQLHPNDKAQFTFTNSRLPQFHLLKLDSKGNPVAGASYRLSKIEDGSRYLDKVTSSTGEILWTDLEPGVYSLVETSTRNDLLLDTKEYHVEMFPGKTSEIVLENHYRPNLYVYKFTAGKEDEPVENCVFEVRAADGHSVDEIRTNADGRAELRNMLPGVYEITEKSVPNDWLKDAPSQLVTLYRDRDRTAYFYDHRKPNITVRKVSSVTGDLLPSAKFHVEYASDATSTGELNDLGYFYTGADGTFTLTHQKSGWFKITEVEPPTGFALNAEPQEFYLAAGDSKTVTVEDTPLSALVIWKFDSVTKAALSSCWFEVKYMTDTSGTGGTVIKTVQTGPNGTATVTGLKKGTYIVSELSSDGQHVIDTPPQTAFISGNEQDVVELFFGNTPKGAVLIRKTDGDGNALRGCEFSVTDSTGALVGDNNGKYVTDASGCALIENLDPGTTLVIKETKCADDSYVLDDVAQTVRVKPGVTVQADFVNLKKGNLLILKQSSADKKTPIEGALFELRYADGRYVDQAGGKLSNNGQYYTDAEGKILVTGICGTVVATELASAAGYSIDEATRTQTVVVRPDDTQTLRFFNIPWQTVIIQKYADDGKKTPLAGVTFLLTDGNGAPIGGGSGEFTTNSAGQIVISASVGSTIKAKEIRTVKGYALNPTVQTITVQGGATAQTVIAGATGSTSNGATVINSGDNTGNELDFYNKTLGKLELVKTDAANKRTRLSSAKYEIRQMNQGVVTTVTTGADGRVVVELGEGDFYAVEVEAPDGYKVDPTPHYFTVKDGETTTLELTDKAISGIELHKIDANSGEGIYGAKFLVYDDKDNVVGELSTNDRGFAHIELDAGRYRLRELECQGYVVDTKLRDVTVKSGGFALVEWKNTPITGQIMVTKYAAEANSVTGQEAGTPLQGATYEIINPRNLAVVAHITTDARGIAASKPLPLGRYQVREVSSPAYWQVSSQMFDVTLEYAGQIIKLAAYDKPSELGVVLTKTGIKEVLAGNRMAYTFTVANTSNVPLDSFYFHDKIPYDVTSATALTTGTYSQRLTYRILYKTNVNGYRVLASNLLTSNNYAFQLSGLQLMAGEVVTDILYDFSKVPAGFQSVAKPTLTVSVNPAAVNGYQVINRADAGGQYGGTWQTANASWITIVINLNPPKTTPLPKTGY